MRCIPVAEGEKIGQHLNITDGLVPPPPQGMPMFQGSGVDKVAGCQRHNVPWTRGGYLLQKIITICSFSEGLPYVDIRVIWLGLLSICPQGEQESVKCVTYHDPCSAEKEQKIKFGTCPLDAYVHVDMCAHIYCWTHPPHFMNIILL